MKITHEDALIVVDVQNDFCHGGALPVPLGEQVVAPLNFLAIQFDTLVYSRDWHPHDHCSFAEDPVYVDKSWPPHCIQDTPGAEFHGELHVASDALIVSKGTQPEAEAYSAFQGTGLKDKLDWRKIKRVFVGGLATDYCVLSTVLDALKAGYEVWVVEDACRGVSPETTQAAWQAMREGGAHVCRARDFEE